MSWKPQRRSENLFVAAGRPSHIGGRFAQRQEAFDWIEANARQPFVVTGARGTGKTTLATWVVDQLTYSRDAMVPVAYCRGDGALSLIDQLVRDDTSSTSTEISAGIPWLKAGVTTTSTSSRPLNLVQALRPDAYVVVDEAQRLSADDLSQLAAFLEYPGDEFSGQVMLLGTPLLHTRFADPEGSFGVFARAPVAVMTPHQSTEEVAELIEGTISHTDLRFDDAAVRRIVEVTDGYPPAVQALCSAAVRRSRRVTIADVERATPQMHSRLDQLFQQMLQRQGRPGRPPTGRNAVLAALAIRPRTAPELAELTGYGRSSIQRIRSDLLDAGLLDIDATGHWSLAIPLMRHHLLPRGRTGATDSTANPPEY